MSFLKKLGLTLVTVASDVLGLAPFVSPLITGLLGSNPKAQAVASTVINDFSKVGQVVVQTEAILQGAGNGAQKLQAATPLVAQIIKTSELLAGKKIANEALFIQGAQKITSGTADVLNSLDGSELPAGGSPSASSSSPMPSA